MITLTTAPEINSILGGNAPVQYNKLVLGPFQLDPVGGTVSGTIRLTSTAAPAMQAIRGTLVINIAQNVLTVEVGQLDFYRQVQLNVGQVNSVNTIITNAQNALEAGMVSLGVIAGVQATGV
jgi:hypothetical protein